MTFLFLYVVLLGMIDNRKLMFFYAFQGGEMQIVAFVFLLFLYTCKC